MSHSSHQSVESGRPGLRKEFRRIDYDIWLWTVGKKLTKRQIKEHAKAAFENAGITQFKASDGWYRRWIARWGRNRESPMNDPKHEKTDTSLIRLNNVSPVDVSNSTPTTSEESSEILRPQDCPEPQEGSSLVLTVSKPCIETPLMNVTQDLAETSGLNKPRANNGAKKILPKKKIERYLPHFKVKVVSYALKFSIKDAVYKYKVNKSTISDWIREEQKEAEIVRGDEQEEVRPDRDFVEWLQLERKSGRLITKDLLLRKFKEIMTYNNKELATKKTMWFYKYVDRFNEESASSNTHIMYPTSFKRELAKLCGQWSKKTIGRIFNVDRKRITSWVERYLKDNYTAVDRKVSCYLTDDKIDNDLWEWYRHQVPKPTSKQIREQAVLLYRQGGYSGINCSSGWYYRWRKRYMLPSSTTEKKDFDNQLICWILNEFDDNKSITHAQLISKATSIKGDGFKLSPSWIVRFLKRYSSFIKKTPGVDIKLPPPLDSEASAFQSDLLNVININAIELNSILAFDEVPLHFSTTGHLQPKYLLRKTGFENCHASLIIVCTAAGKLLPTTLILNTESEDIDVDSNSNVKVAYQPEGMADVELLQTWYSALLETLDYPHVIICDSYKPHKALEPKSLPSGDQQLMIIPAGCSWQLLPTLFCVSEEFKKAVASHWEIWLQQTCWSNGNQVKLPSALEIKNWVELAHQKCSVELQDAVKNSFSSILHKS